MQIRNYREQNQLPDIPYLETVVENYLCGLPENVGKCDKIKIKRGILEYIKGGVALLENVFYGESNMVSEEVANSRAAICIECPYNVFPDKGPFIEWSDKLAEAATHGKRSIHHTKLGNCMACQCPLRAKVWYGGKIKLTKEERAKMGAVGCWQIKE